MTELISVYITAATADEAAAIARVLVEERLAGCVNIMPGLRSIYRWEGRVHDEAETALIAKTKAALFDALCARVKILHSYSCPCIVATPIIAGEPSWLDWLGRQLSPAQE